MNPTRRYRRVLSSLTAATAAVVATILVGPAAAVAHVTADPSSAPAQGGYGQVRLVVPSEKDNTATVGLTVTLPDTVNLESVRTLPIPGWSVRIDQQHTGATTRVSRIVWTSDPGTGLGPTEFGVFTFTGGRWPADVTTVALPVEQRYGDGSVVNWNEVSEDAGAEPENPAPVVTLTPATSGVNDHGGESSNASAAETPDDQESLWPKVISVVALVVAIVALATSLAFWRTRSHSRQPPGE